MELKEIAAVAGKSGLYKVIKPTRTGVILESLDAQKKKSIANANSRVSILKEISIYTTGVESSILLEDVFETIHSKFGKELKVSSKSSEAELVNFIKEVVPNYDEERVYLSDIKKLTTWYSLVSTHAPELFETIKKEPTKAKKSTEKPTAEKKETKKPVAKKEVAKKEPAKKTTKESTSKTTKKPKAASKKA